MKWVPSWLAKCYAMVYTAKRTEWFDFEEAKNLLGIGDKSVLSLRLTRLEDAGFLISRRDSVDRRRKYFRLIDPGDVVFSYGIQSLSASEDLVGRLTAASASKHIDFVVGGSYAAYVYGGYASPGKIDIYINKQDGDRWISLLAGKFTSLSFDDILAEKAGRTNVHMHTSLSKEMLDDSVLLDGIRYVRPETLVVEGLLEQTEFSITDSLAVVTGRRKEIDFDRLLKIAESENLERELGACLEIINSEAKRRIFPPEIIARIHSKTDVSRKRFFPRSGKEESAVYKEISDKWGLRITLPRALVSKIVTYMVSLPRLSKTGGGLELASIYSTKSVE